MDAPTSARVVDGPGRGLLIASVVFGLGYFVESLGLEAPYPLDVVIKTAGVALLAIYAGLRRHGWLAAALGLGAVGDVMLALRPAQMSLGIAAFGLGHVIYLALFVGIGRREGTRGSLGWIGAGVLAVFGLGMLIYLQPHFGQLRVPASIYNGVIIVMACTALAVRSPTLAWLGALSFVGSDVLLALRLFAGMLPWAGPIVWLSYYAAQLLLTLGLTLGLTRGQARAMSLRAHERPAS